MGDAEQTPAENSDDKCPCIDASTALASLEDRLCDLPSSSSSSNIFYSNNSNNSSSATTNAAEQAEKGVLLAVGGACVPFTYGSNACSPHDLLHNGMCHPGPITSTNSTAAPLPPFAFCEQQWCFVDFEKCMGASSEVLYRSDNFPKTDLFYSYTNCNATPGDWTESLKQSNLTQLDAKVLDGISVTATIPSYQLPFLFKRDPVTGDKLGRAHSSGEAYYDDAIPYEGIYTDFVKSIIDLSGGDIQAINYTHRTKGSDRIYPDSTFTAAVRDVQSGLSDMGVGPFWITGERLRMTSFTVPFIFDKTVLVVERPIENKSLGDQTKKMFEPFDPTLWCLVFVTILVAAILGVWISDPGQRGSSSKEHRRRSMRLSKKRSWDLREASVRRRLKVFSRFCVDAILEKGMYFCGGSVEQDPRASLPHKLLMFGYGFFILITVSSYTANLAAFLSSSPDTFVDSMEVAVGLEKVICVHPALEKEVKSQWPDAKLLVPTGITSGDSYMDLLREYDKKKMNPNAVEGCHILALGTEDTQSDAGLMEELCKRNLVFTDGVVLEIPMGFPIRPDLSAGFSYWFYVGEKYHNISLQNIKEKFKPTLSCEIEYSFKAGGGDQLTVHNMLFPFLVFVVLASVAVVLQLVLHRRANSKTGRNVPSSLGRASRLFNDNEMKSVRNFNASMVTSDIDDDDHHPTSNNKIVSFFTNDRDVDLDSCSDHPCAENNDVLVSSLKNTGRVVESAMRQVSSLSITETGIEPAVPVGKPHFPHDERLQTMLDNFIEYLQEMKEQK